MFFFSGLIGNYWEYNISINLERYVVVNSVKVYVLIYREWKYEFFCIKFKFF